MPLYAVRIVPGSLGTFAGLKTDQHARVLDRRGAPIGGLYAAGNDMNSIMGDIIRAAASRWARP
jgi:predicted oxidoreductase